MGNHYQLSLVLHQGGGSINPYTHDRWPLSGNIPFADSFLPGPSLQSLLLLLLSLVHTVGQLKCLSSCLVVQGLSELINCERHFQTLPENNLLPL